MLEIFRVVRQVYNNRITTTAQAKWTEDFRAGYRHCLDLFMVGMERHPTYNMHIQNRALLEQVAGLEMELAQAKLRINELGDARRQVRAISEINCSLNQELADQKELLHEMGLLVSGQSQSALAAQITSLLGKYAQAKKQLRAS